MVICSRCEQQVDETTRTTCPLCFTPLPTANTTAQPEAPQAAAPSAAPPATTMGIPPLPAPGMASGQPAMPQPLAGGLPNLPTPPQPAAPMSPSVAAMRPGARVSLTGEVYDSAEASNAPPPSYVGNTSAGPVRPMSAPGTARATTGPGAHLIREEAPEKSGAGAMAAVVVVLVLLVGGGGWWWMHRTNPKDQTQKLFEAVKASDYKQIYSLLDLTEDQQKATPDAESFTKKAEDEISKAGPLGSMIKSAMSGIQIKKIGEPTYNDEGASVPVTVSMPIMGQNQEMNNNIQLKNHGGAWKVVTTGLLIPGLGTMGGGMTGAMGGGMGGGRGMGGQ